MSKKLTGHTRGLLPFKPGQSGNPGGRPKGFSLTRLMREELQRIDPAQRKSNAEVIIANVVEAIKAGDYALFPQVWRYMDGDPKAAADLTLRELAVQLAERLGLDPDELLATFERDQKSA